MAEARIPVDVFNPGQVFACLGLMEATDILLGNAVGYFDKKKNSHEFVITCKGDMHPVEAIAEFLLSCQIDEICPMGWKPWEREKDDKKRKKIKSKIMQCTPSEKFPSRINDLSLQDLPILLQAKFAEKDIKQILFHWIDGEWPENFKLYSGNRSAHSIAKTMIWGSSSKKIIGINGIYNKNKEIFIRNPMNELVPMGGSFNFDARGAWNSINAGYSPDKQDQKVLCSPFVEFMSIWGLQYARPKIKDRTGFYAIWYDPMPVNLARVFLGCKLVGKTKCFRFLIASSGKNKTVNYAEETVCYDN